MEVEDVIELGSSDDEAEPPPAKKIKPLPNAMVHIPNTIRDVTINPVKCSKNKASKKLVTKVPNQIPLVTMSRTNINGRQSKSNGRFVQNSTLQPSSQNLKTDNLNIYPIKVLQRKPLKMGTWNSGVQRPRVQGISPKLISRLPPSITVTKSQGGSSTHNLAVKNKIRVNKELANKFGGSKNKIYPTSCLGDILTVELDDDDENTSALDNNTPAQWYMRPEEQVEKNILEEQNNSEPKGKEMIEITIEDSPVKPCVLERAKNDTLSITIDDSPVKVINKLPKDGNLPSDTEKDKPKSPNSKKKLDYPETESNKVTMEIDSGNVIESEPKEVKDKDQSAFTTVTKETNSEKNTEEAIMSTDLEQANDTTPRKDNLVENSKDGEKNNSTDKDVDVSNECSREFHPTFQQFMDLCLEIDTSEDMKTIVEKRIKTYSRQVSKEFIESEQFLDMVSIKITLIKSESSKIYLHIKDIVDELKLHRKRKKETPIANENNIVEDVDDTNKYDRKRQRQIRKLEKTLKKLEKAINKLDEQEVDFDDEEDSVYLLNDRYKERFVRTYAKLCQLTDTKMLTEPRIVIECRPGQPPGPAKRLEKWINKKVPIGSTLPFPDFHDVIKCVREANAQDKLGWDENDILEEARDLFTRCGKKLQRRRQENEWRLAASRISQNLDPAEKDETLRNKLEENKKKASKNETEVLNKYAQKQNQLNLEPTEIDDKEADNSPVESDDEVDDDSDLLEDRQKRKDRLQRLIAEKEHKKKSLINTDQLTGLETEKKSEPMSLQIENKENGTETENINDGEIMELEKSKETEKNMETETDFDIQISMEKTNINKTSERESGNKETDAEIIDDFNKEQILSQNIEEIDSDDSIEQIDDSPKSLVNLESNHNEKENVHFICDDFFGDELNLLEKLNSGNESSSGSSDESPIAISDSEDSNSESEHYDTYDVISVGNSSCSDTEVNKDSSEKNKDSFVNTIETLTSDTDRRELLSEVLTNQNKKPEIGRKKSINDLTPSDNESENIPLAYSEDEENSQYVNVQKDFLTIGETLVDDVDMEKMAKDVDSHNSEGNVISEDNNTILSAEKNMHSVEIGDSNNQEVTLKNCDEDHGDINKNGDSCVQKYTGNDESLSISDKVNEEVMICDNQGIDPTDSATTNDKKLEDPKPNEKQSNKNSNDSQLLTKKIAESNQGLEPVVPKSVVEPTTTKTTSESNQGASGELIPLGASQVRETKDPNGQLITTEPDQELEIPEVIGDPITVEVNQGSILDKSSETVLLEENSDTKPSEESGEGITLKNSQKSTMMDKCFETLLLEDSRDVVTDKEIEPEKFEATREPKELEASRDLSPLLDQEANKDQKTLPMNDEPMTFDTNVEPITLETGEEPNSVEDKIEEMSPCILEEPEASTSGVNNNVSNSNESVIPSIQKSETLEHTFNMVEMMLDKLFNPSP